MSEYVADTHALFWYLTAAPQLGANALAAFGEGEQGQARIYLPSIVLAELYCSVRLNFALWLMFRICAKRQRIVGAVSKHALSTCPMSRPVGTRAYLEIAPTMVIPLPNGKTGKEQNST
jgi:hypothetical protein